MLIIAAVKLQGLKQDIYRNTICVLKCVDVCSIELHYNSIDIRGGVLCVYARAVKEQQRKK